MHQAQLERFLCEALEVETGGAQIYEAAIECAENEELREEWGEYLAQTREHARILRNVCERLGIDAEQRPPGREIARATAEALLDNIRRARESGDSSLAQIVAAEAVTLAEAKDHLDWQLIGLIAKESKKGDHIGEILQEAFDQVEDQEEEHLFHSTGWARELWAQSLGLDAVFPPPEEKLGTKVPKKTEREVLKQRSKQNR